MRDHIAGRADQRIVELAEEHRLLGRLLVLLLTVTQIVQADADDLFRIGDRRQQLHVAAQRLPLEVAEFGLQLLHGSVAGRNEADQVLHVRTLSGQIDHLAAVLGQ